MCLFICKSLTLNAFREQDTARYREDMERMRKQAVEREKQAQKQLRDAVLHEETLHTAEKAALVQQLAACKPWLDARTLEKTYYSDLCSRFLVCLPIYPPAFHMHFYLMCVRLR